MAENKVTPETGVPEATPTAETTPAPAVETTAPTATTAETPAVTTAPKTKKSPFDIVKKFLAKFKKEKKAEPVTA